MSLLDYWVECPFSLVPHFTPLNTETMYLILHDSEKTLETEVTKFVYTINGTYSCLLNSSYAYTFFFQLSEALIRFVIEFCF